MEQCRAERLGVEPQAGADLRDLYRVCDEVLARATALVGMALAGEGEGGLDGITVDGSGAPLGVLGDDGQKVAKQRSFLGRERLGELVDRGGRCRGSVAGSKSGVTSAIRRTLGGPSLPVPSRAGLRATFRGAVYSGCLRLLRNPRPSS